MGNHRQRKERAVTFAPIRSTSAAPLLGAGRLTYTEAVAMAEQCRASNMRDVTIVACDTGWSVSAQLRTLP